MSAVTPFLWFDDTAEEAITFYTALIPDSEVVSIDRYPDEVPGMGGKVMHAHFRLGGRDYYAMDAGPQFPFTEAFSLYVSCADSGRGRPLLGRADRGRRSGAAVRLAQGPLGPVVADHPRPPGRADPRPGPRRRAPRRAGDAADAAASTSPRSKPPRRTDDAARSAGGDRLPPRGADRGLRLQRRHRRDRRPPSAGAPRIGPSVSPTSEGRWRVGTVTGDARVRPRRAVVGRAARRRRRAHLAARRRRRARADRRRGRCARWARCRASCRAASRGCTDSRC